MIYLLNLPVIDPDTRKTYLLITWEVHLHSRNWLAGIGAKPETFLSRVKASAHSFKQFTSRLLKSTFSLSLCTYITRIDVMLDFICMGPVDLTGTRRKLQNTKWKSPCPQWDSNPQPFDPKSDALPTELAGLGECCLFKWPYYIHVLPILMFTLLYLPEWWSRA